MTTEPIFRFAFLFLLVALITMRIYFMVKVRRSGGRIMPDKQAVDREGGNLIFVMRVVAFFALIGLLMMYFTGAAWIDAFSFCLPSWLRWAGFFLGLIMLAFWTWTQITLDTQWSAQLQLTKNHHLITTGPYAYVRHPLYMGVFGWCIALVLLTANWIFLAVCGLSIAGLIWRIPKEERMMLEAFGDEYKQYMAHTGRFLPRFK